MNPRDRATERRVHARAVAARRRPCPRPYEPGSRTTPSDVGSTPAISKQPACGRHLAHRVQRAPRAARGRTDSRSRQRPRRRRGAARSSRSIDPDRGVVRHPLEVDPAAAGARRSVVAARTDRVGDQARAADRSPGQPSATRCSPPTPSRTRAADVTSSPDELGDQALVFEQRPICPAGRCARQPHEGRRELPASRDLVTHRGHGMRPASAAQERQVVGRVGVLRRARRRSTGAAADSDGSAGGRPRSAGARRRSGIETKSSSIDIDAYLLEHRLARLGAAFGMYGCEAVIVCLGPRSAPNLVLHLAGSAGLAVHQPLLSSGPSASQFAPRRHPRETASSSSIDARRL